MDSIYLGIVIVFFLIGYQFWTRSRSRRIFTESWKAGNEAASKGDWESAEKAVRRAAKVFPTGAPVHRVLGAILAQRGNLREAEDHLRLGANLEPRNPAGHLDLGMFLALYLPERAGDAAAAFEAAVECAPQIRDALRDDPRLAALRSNDRFRRLIGGQS